MFYHGHHTRGEIEIINPRWAEQPDYILKTIVNNLNHSEKSTLVQEMNNRIKVHPLEPSNSPTMSTGFRVGKHRIQGISDEFIPSILDLNSLDPVISVDDGDSIIMAQKLSNELGIGVGISSGANFLGAVIVQNQLGKDANVVTVFPDSNKKYLSTNLLNEEPVKDDFYSSHINLKEFRAFKRVCHTCCDPLECFEKDYLDENDEMLPYCPRRERSKKSTGKNK